MVALSGAEAAHAGAWNLPKGQGEIIVKYENIRAEDYFTSDGGRADLPGGRRDIAASVFVEYGLSERFTLQAKGEWQDGRDEFLDYQGLGPIEMGVRWQAYRDDRNVAALYVGYAEGGAGRNAGYAPPGAGDSDVEVRLLAGRSFDRGFIDLQAARRWRCRWRPRWCVGSETGGCRLAGDRPFRVVKFLRAEGLSSESGVDFSPDFRDGIRGSPRYRYVICVTAVTR
ncbi:hypothetical protein [Brevundimonas sp. RM1]